MAKKIELDLRDYIRIVRRQKWKIIVITTTVGLLTFVLSVLTKPLPLYQSTASVKVESQRAGTEFYSGQQAQEYSVIASQSSVIKSFFVITDAAKAVGLINNDLSTEELQDDPKIVSMILDMQMNSIMVAQEADTNIIDITAINMIPQMARDLANAIANEYKRRNYEKNVKQAKITREFIEGRLKVSRAKMHESENKLKVYEETEDIVNLTSQSQLLLQSRLAQEEKLTQIQTSLDQMNLLKVFFAQDDISEMSLDIRKGIYSGFFQDAIKSLSNLMIKKSSLLQVYTPQHPQVVSIENEIKSAIQNVRGQVNASIDILNTEADLMRQELKDSESDLEIIPNSNLMHSRLGRDVKTQNGIVLLLEQKYQEALIREADQMEEVSIVRPALLPVTAINPPNIGLKSFIGAFLGLVLGLIFGFIFEHFDTSFDTIDDIESIVKLNVTGVIPFMPLKELLFTVEHEDNPVEISEDDATSRLVMHYFPKTHMAESFRSLRTNMVFDASESKAKVIGITSSLPGEGKSTISSNMALALAQAGKQVLLIDGDLRKSTLHGIFGVENSPGLVDLILESVEPSSVIRNITDIMIGSIGMELIARTPGWDNLEFIPTGQTNPTNVTEILDSDMFKSYLKKWREKYDYIIVDCTPVLAVSDALIVAPFTDKTLVVYRVGLVGRGSLSRTKALLDGVKANLMGIVINGLKQESSADFGQYTESYYGSYAYGQDSSRGSLKARVIANVKKGYETVTTKISEFREGEGGEEDDEAESTISKITGIALLGMTIAMMTVGFLHSVHSWEEFKLQFGGVDFMLSGIFLLFMILFYFGASFLMNKFGLAEKISVPGRGLKHSFKRKSAATPGPAISEEDEGEEALSDDELSEEDLGEGELAEKPLSDDELSDEPLGEDELSEEPLSDDELSDEPLGESELSEEPLGDEGSSEEQISETKISGETYEEDESYKSPSLSEDEPEDVGELTEPYLKEKADEDISEPSKEIEGKIDVPEEESDFFEPEEKQIIDDINEKFKKGKTKKEKKDKKETDKSDDEKTDGDDWDTFLDQ